MFWNHVWMLVVSRAQKIGDNVSWTSLPTILTSHRGKTKLEQSRNAALVLFNQVDSTYHHYYTGYLSQLYIYNHFPVDIDRPACY